MPHRRPVAVAVALLVISLGLPLARAESPRFKPDANLPRARVPDGAKWDLKPLFRDDTAFAAALKKSAADRKALAGYQGKLADPAKLRECLDRYFAARLLHKKLTLYTALQRDTDTRSSAVKDRADRAQQALADFMAGAGFIRREVMALDDAALKAALDREPGLLVYRGYLEELRRRRAHVLGVEGERVLGLAGDNLWAEIDLNEIPSDLERTFQALVASLVLPVITDEEGKPVQLTFSNYNRYRSSADRRVRGETVDKLFAALRGYQDVFAATLGGQIRQNVFMARAHGYDTALAAYLDRDNIDPAVYRNLIRTVRANLGPLHRYVRLRKKVMGLKEVRIHDLFPPLVPGVRWEIPYDEGARMVVAALAPLGEAYVKVLRGGLDPANGWIDVYPHKDKDSGAECLSAYGVHPWVMMNYLDDVDDVSTLAHEFGHAMHAHLSFGSQPYPSSDAVIFIAEIASTFNEVLLSDYLVKHARNDAERLYILNNLLETIRMTIYRQTLFAEFELALHTAAEKGQPLTADLMNRTYADLIRTYYGKDFTVGANDGIEWAYIPHFYYKYYVFSYATGLSSGIALAEKVKAGDVKARDAYLGMLKAGASKPPLRLLADAGADLTRPDAIVAATRLMDRTIAEMEKILARQAKAARQPKK